MTATIISGLILSGFFLVIIEVFVPGGIFGIIGTTLIVAGVLGAWFKYGSEVAVPLAFGCMVGGVLCFAFWVKYFPTSWLGRRMSLEAQNSQSEGYTSQDSRLLELVGQQGVAMTELRPAGVARIGEHRIDVVTEGTFVEKGAAVRVTGVSSNRVVVRKINEEA
jgi:membrane-bound serine protease (ClpP class)